MKDWTYYFLIIIISVAAFSLFLFSLVVFENYLVHNEVSFCEKNGGEYFNIDKCIIKEGNDYVRYGIVKMSDGTYHLYEWKGVER